MLIVLYIAALLLVSLGMVVWYTTRDTLPEMQDEQQEDTPSTTYEETIWYDRYIVSFNPMTFEDGFTVDAERDVQDIMKQLRRRMKQRQHQMEHQKATLRADDDIIMAYTFVQMGMERYRLALTMHDHDEAMFVLLIQCDSDPTVYGAKLLEDVLDALQFLPIDNIKTYLPESFELDLGMGAVDWFNERGQEGSVH